MPTMPSIPGSISGGGDCTEHRGMSYPARHPVALPAWLAAVHPRSRRIVPAVLSDGTSFRNRSHTEHTWKPAVYLLSKV